MHTVFEAERRQTLTPKEKATFRGMLDRLAQSHDGDPVSLLRLINPELSVAEATTLLEKTTC